MDKVTHWMVREYLKEAMDRLQKCRGYLIQNQRLQSARQVTIAYHEAQDVYDDMLSESEKKQEWTNQR